MATLPTVPSFGANDTSLTNLQNLSYSVSFLINCGVRPLWHFIRTATFSMSAGFNNPGYATVIYDSDGVQTSGLAQIVTQGYYAVEGCSDLSTGSSGIAFDTRFLLTAGANNPHLTLGSTRVFGQRGGNSVATASTDTAVTLTDICPIVCYPGDTLQYDTYVNSATSLNFNQNTSYIAGRFVANFTGYFVRTGT
jgi:hypothetical protein